jgi:hypothetical protein
LQARGAGFGLARRRQRTAACELHHSACGDLWVPSAGRNQPGPLERTRRDLEDRGSATLVEHLVVQDNLGRLTSLPRICCLHLSPA